MSPKVPNEILIKIFQQLHPIDQLECTLVCHRWNQLLEDSVLYHTVYIFSAIRLKKLLQKIQQRPDIANKIERLALWSKGEEDYSRSKLLSLVPNLKVLSHKTPTVLDNKTQYPWYNHIEYISEVADEYFIDYSLSCNAYPNLKTFSYKDWYSSSYHPLVKNATALTNLNLISNGVKMGFDDLECIHKNSPHLKSIKLNVLCYKGGAVFSGKEIIPATSVTEFLTHVDCDNYYDDHVNRSRPELHAELLEYISRKYPNLSTFEYIIEGYKELEYYEVVQAGWNPLLQRLGPQLKKVSVYFSGEEEQYIEALDRFDCQINYLDLDCGHHMGVAKMALSKQAFYIQTLVLHITDSPLDWLKNFRVLKKLELTYKSDYRSPKLQLSDILDNSPPTLESLFLYTDRFDINPSYTGTSNIKTLTFESMKFDDKVDGFISRCFPHLSVLELRQCKLQNNMLILEKTDLASFYYFGDAPYHFSGREDIIMITTLKDNKRRSYVSHNRKYRLEEVFYPQNYRPFKSYPANDISDPKLALNFIFNSVINVGFTT